MKIPAAGCRVYSTEDGQFSVLGSWTAAIFVPPGAVDRIENTGMQTVRAVSSCCPEDHPGASPIKRLGAFYPSGSPGEAYEPGAPHD